MNIIQHLNRDEREFFETLVELFNNKNEEIFRNPEAFFDQSTQITIISIYDTVENYLDVFTKKYLHHYSFNNKHFLPDQIDFACSEEEITEEITNIFNYFCEVNNIKNYENIFNSELGFNYPEFKNSIFVKQPELLYKLNSLFTLYILIKFFKNEFTEEFFEENSEVIIKLF